MGKQLTAGTVALQLTANAAKLKAGLKNAQQHWKKFAQQSKMTVKAAAVAGAAAAAGLGYAVKRQLDAVDDLAKVSDRLGQSTEGLAGLHHAATLASQSGEMVNKSLARQTRFVSEAKSGMGTYVKIMDELGLNAAELARMQPADQFKAIAEAMNGLDTQSDRVRIAMQIWGQRGSAMLDVMREDLDGAAQEAKELGLTVSRFDAARIEQAGTNLARMGQIAAGFARQLAVRLAPGIAVITDKIVMWTREAGGMPAIVEKIGISVEKTMTFFSDWSQRFRILWQAMRTAFYQARVWTWEFIRVTVQMRKRLWSEMQNIGNTIIAGFDLAFAGAKKIWAEMQLGFRDTMNNWLKDYREFALAMSGLASQLGMDAIASELFAIGADFRFGADKLKEQLNEAVDNLSHATDNFVDKINTIGNAKVQTPWLDDIVRTQRLKLAEETNWLDALVSTFGSRSASWRRTIRGWFADVDAAAEETTGKAASIHSPGKGGDAARKSYLQSMSSFYKQAGSMAKNFYNNLKNHAEQAMKRAAQERRAKLQENDLYVRGIADANQNLAQLMEQAAENNRAAFYAHKVFAVASATANAWLAFSNTLAMATKFGGPLNTTFAQVLAGINLSAGLGAAAQIAATPYAGGRMHGGIVPAGSTARVGENGPEIWRAGGKQWMFAGERGEVVPSHQIGGQPIIINNYGPPPEESTDGEGRRILTFGRQVASMLAGDILSRRGPLNSALERRGLPVAGGLSR
jgi:hypothetical protein